MMHEQSQLDPDCLWREVYDLFNESNKRGVELMLSSLLVDGAAGVARAFLGRAGPDGLDKKQIGDFIGGFKPINASTRNEFVKMFGFAGLSFVAGLRQFLNAFRCDVMYGRNVWRRHSACCSPP